jgi:mannose-6-phosphate isomerase-like protein (cupin superfamily)
LTDFYEVQRYEGSGYKPLISFGAWRVAVLRFLDELKPERIFSMERHLSTDEVFILIQGKALLFIGGNNSIVNEIHSVEIHIGEVCDVKKATWHTLVLTEDAQIIIVENDDTNLENSETIQLHEKTRSIIYKIAKEFLNEDDFCQVNKLS